jgi:hypothetical protein
MDGVTTNGILLMHIDGDQFNQQAKSTRWREVTVCGSVFDLGDGRLKFDYQTSVMTCTMMMRQTFVSH